MPRTFMPQLEKMCETLEESAPDCFSGEKRRVSFPVLQILHDREIHAQVQHDPQRLPLVPDQHVLDSGVRIIFAALFR